jgi:cytochrome P450
MHADRPQLHPPRWAPTFVRWHHTRVGWITSWRLALRGIWAGYRHTIFDYAARLPGQDDIVVARVPLAKFVVIRNPDIARHILVTNQDNYAKSAEYDLLAVAFGRGLVTDLDDGTWQRNRRLVQPIFAKRNADAMEPQMTAAALAAAERWQSNARTGRPVDIAAEMNYITMDVIARTMFGIDLTGPLAEQMRVDFARLLTIFGYGSSAAAHDHCAGSPTGYGGRGCPSTRCAGKQRFSRRAPCAGCAASNGFSISLSPTTAAASSTAPTTCWRF